MHTYHRSYWDVDLASNVSWGWRKLLQIRPLVRPHIWYKLGNGYKASVWFDKWEESGPLMNHLSYRAIANAGYTLQAKVKDVVLNEAWTWPDTWFASFPVLNNIYVLLLIDDQDDILQWKKCWVTEFPNLLLTRI